MTDGWLKGRWERRAYIVGHTAGQMRQGACPYPAGTEAERRWHYGHADGRQEPAADGGDPTTGTLDTRGPA